MPLYSFSLCNAEGVASSFESHQLPYDGETIAKAGELLAEHLGCDHIEVWDGDRAIVARFRDQPIIRPVDEPAAPAGDQGRQALRSSYRLLRRVSDETSGARIGLR